VQILEEHISSLEGWVGMVDGPSKRLPVDVDDGKSKCEVVLLEY